MAEQKMEAPVEAKAKVPALVDARGEPADAKAAGGKKAPNKALRIVGALALGAALVTAVLVFVNRGNESTDDAQVEADVVPLAPRVGGMVLHVLVADNSRVKKGQPLVELDPADNAAKEKQAEGELATTQAQADAAEQQAKVADATARGGLGAAQARVSGSAAAAGNAGAQVDSAKAQLARAEADAKKAQQDLARMKELLAAQVVPQDRVDAAQAANDSAQASLLGARAGLQAAIDQKTGAVTKIEEARGQLQQSQPVNAMVAVARANAALAEARVTTAEASLELAKLQLSYTKIFAPEDGVMTRLSAHEGQLIGPGQAIATLVPKAVYIVANFKETQVGRMHEGQDVEVRIDSFAGTTLHGTLESMAGGTGARFALLPPDNASGNFVKVVQRVPVRIALKDLPAGVTLRAGMSADVVVKTRSK
jgi:membrane fusion protein (multidrug efflux system)